MTSITHSSIPLNRANTASGRTILHRLLATNSDGVSLFLRAVLGIVMLPHAAQKVFGWFGGYGFSNTMGYFTQQEHIPALFAFLAIAAEFAGSIGLLTGFLTRLAAFGILSVMTGAALLVHMPNGFFMNWTGQQAGEGFEYHILAASIAIYLIVKGGGKASVDGVLVRNK